MPDCCFSPLLISKRETRRESSRRRRRRRRTSFSQRNQGWVNRSVAWGSEENGCLSLTFTFRSTFLPSHPIPAFHLCGSRSPAPGQALAPTWHFFRRKLFFIAPKRAGPCQAALICSILLSGLAKSRLGLPGDKALASSSLGGRRWRGQPKGRGGQQPLPRLTPNRPLRLMYLCPTKRCQALYYLKWTSLSSLKQ